MDEMDGGNIGFRPAPPEADVRLFGLTLLADPPSAALDVVFVHGFTGHPRRTWAYDGKVPQENRATQSNDISERPSKFRRLLSSESSKKAAARTNVFWPQDLLPTTLPNARVYTYGYDSSIRHRLGTPANKSTVYDLGYNLLLSLDAKRNCQPSRPLVFVAHSLGGIVVKEALRRSEGYRTHHGHLHSIYDATIAILCFGTPHSGADPRGVVHRVAEAVVRLTGFTVNDQLVNSLLPSSERLKELRDEFSRMSRSKNWLLFSFQEQYGLKVLNGDKVVEDTSSTFGDPTIEIAQHIANDHMEMCRFKGLNDGEYEKVAAAFRRVSQAIEDNEGQKVEVCSETSSSTIEPPNITEAVTAEQKKAYLDSLSFQQVNAQLLNIKKAHDKTCNWLFEQLEYKQWLDRDLADNHHGFLWIKGKPGAGKSTMMKHALFETKKQLASVVVISFFFNARGDILEKSTLGMYRSLLLQLLTAIPSLQNDFVRMFPRKREYNDVYEWNIEDLQDFFMAAAKGLQQYRLVCFIDALDECEENEVRELVEFLEDLGETAVSSGTSLNVCLSSRHYPYIRIRKGIQLTVEGQGGHDKDIATYVESKFRVPHNKQMDDIRAEILSRARGVFLWVVLVVKMLNKEYDHGQIHALRRRLSEIPDELDDLFADILIRDAERRDESILCLQWLLFAQRPLKREELYFAVLSGTEPTALRKWDATEVSNQTIDRFVLSCSKGLAEASKGKDQTIQFIHESVRDFFLLRNGLAKLKLDRAVNMVGLSQDRLKKCCYQYIMTDMFEDPLNDNVPRANSQAGKDLRDKTLEKFPFLEYAVRNIFSHADTAQGCGISQKEFLRGFDPPSFAMRKWINFDSVYQRDQIRRYTPKARLLYILSEKNLSNLVKVSLEGNADVDTLGERYGNAIQAASANGHTRIVRLLIDAGADIKIVGGEYGDSLTAAVENNHEAVVKLLLEQGASQNKKFGVHNRDALLWAAWHGHDAVMRLLLANPMVEPNSKTITGWTPLSFATAKGHKVIVQLLLANPKVDPNLRDGNGWTPLIKAAQEGHEAIVQLLLANPIVDPNLKTPKGWTPLSFAAIKGHEVIVQLLLAHPKVDPNLRDGNGWTPLIKAAQEGHEATVQLLLANPKVDPNLRYKDGQTPLSMAAVSGHEAIVQLLLANPKVDPNLRDMKGRTPLSWAISRGHEAVAQLFKSAVTGL